MTEEQRIEAFLNGLTQLTQKYGIEVAGCGCCGSPFLDNVSKDSLYNVSEEPILDAEKLEYDSETESYIIHNCNGSERFL